MPAPEPTYAQKAQQLQLQLDACRSALERYVDLQSEVEKMRFRNAAMQTSMMYWRDRTEEAEKRITALEEQLRVPVDVHEEIRKLIQTVNVLQNKL